MSINWAILKAKNRVKDIEVSWTDEEVLAIQSGVDPEEIRSGKWKPAKAPEAPEKDANTGSNSDLENLTKKQLLAKAVELGVEVPEDATKAEIVTLIKSK